MKECKEFEIFNEQLTTYCGKGVKSDFFKKVLAPSWWEHKMAESRNLTISLAMITAKKLGVSLLSLLSSGSRDFLKDTPCAAYKMHSNDSTGKMTGTSAMLCATAKAVLSGIENQNPVENNPLEVRENILSSARYVDLYSLLDYCWSHGIPVLTMTPTVPGASASVAKWHRPDGVAIRDNGKYCIFLPSDKKFQAQHLFYLAHELGHIALGHLKKEGELINDDSITIEGAKSKGEQEANQYAISLLNGEYAFKPNLVTQWPEELARWAVAEGKEHRIDPGHLVLRNANEKSMYPLGMAALNRLNQIAPEEQKNGDRPITLVKSKAYQNIDEKAYSDEQLEQIAQTIDLTIGSVGD